MFLLNDFPHFIDSILIIDYCFMIFVNNSRKKSAVVKYKTIQIKGTNTIFVKCNLIKTRLGLKKLKPTD